MLFCRHRREWEDGLVECQKCHVHYVQIFSSMLNLICQHSSAWLKNSEIDLAPVIRHKSPRAGASTGLSISPSMMEWNGFFALLRHNLASTKRQQEMYLPVKQRLSNISERIAPFRFRPFFSTGLVFHTLPAHLLIPISPTKSNEIGVPFILMSKAQGSPLSTRLWPTHCHAIPNIPTKAGRYLTKEEKEKIMKQLGIIVSQLSYLRLDKIGSLFEEEGCYTVNECLSPGHIWYNRNTIRGIDRGPFHREQDYYQSLISIFRLHIQDLSMEYHIFFAPVPVPQEYRNYASYLSATDRWNDFVTVGSKVDNSKNRLHYHC